MACFGDINILQGSVARCGGIFSIHFTANLPRNLPVIFFKWAKIGLNYGLESVSPLFCEAAAATAEGGLTFCLCFLFIFNDFVISIISTSTGPIFAKLAGVIELWLWMNDMS